MKLDIDELQSTFPGEWRKNFILARSNWFGVGGAAEYWYKPADTITLAALISHYASITPIEVLGVGSNLLVRDGGVKGIVIRLGRGFKQLEIDQDGFIVVGAANLCGQLAEYALAHQIEGLEFYIGIPGTVGGALAMNAGAYGSDTSVILEKAEIITPQGDIRIISVEEVGYVYRGHSLPGRTIFTRAWYKAIKGEPQTISNKMQNIIAERGETQPTRAKTSGSTFKNPPGLKAWQLIDAAGCRGLTIGGAKVSDKHCNFFINTGHATAADLEELILTVQGRVLANSGILLESEVKIIGEPIANG